jgi:Ca2+-binding EF-hand superfamily protein
MGVDEETANATTRSLDYDDDQRIEYSEFVAGLLNFGDNYVHDFLHSAFQKFDLDNSGALDKKEIHALLSEGELNGIGFAPDPDLIDELVQHMDTDGDGSISYEEFISYFTPQLDLTDHDHMHL